MNTFTDAASYVLRFINQTNRSVFLTGRAGTGKTTLLREIIKTTHKNTVVVAPTGIAALNAGGVTIHSMFQLPFAAFIPEEGSNLRFSEHVKFETRETLRRHFRLSAVKQAVIRNMELLVIDEVSMLRSDLLDAIDFMMRSVRKNNRPFGGAQVLFIGDLLQLPPVIGNAEWQTLQRYYAGKFFFHSHVVQQNPPIYIELSKIYRQSDDMFISVLNNLRNNHITAEDLALLNRYVNPAFDLKQDPGYITLTTHNAKADTINTDALGNLKGSLQVYHPEIVGEFPEKIFPVDEMLKLKVGAQVMFVKNDPSYEKNYFNGKTGVIKSLSADEILVHFPEEDRTIEVERYEWKNIRYCVDEATREIREEILGTFVHYPIRLAWAITVHKSQGLTFDKAAIDVSNVFAPGQAYVALSRLRSLEGLILLSPLRMNGIANDEDVMRYAETRAETEILDSALQDETQKYLRQSLKDSFTWNDLAQEWRNHFFSYAQDTSKSVKSKHKNWAKARNDAMSELLGPSLKFGSQLDKLFSAEPVDMKFISDRISSAFDYFFPLLDNLVGEIQLKMQEAGRAKKSRGFLDELSQLEELQTTAVFRLLRAKQLVAAIASGTEITKENLAIPELRDYRQKKVETAREAFRSAGHVLIDDDDEPMALGKKSGKKLPKKSTIEETHELWLEKNSLKEIAALRKLTPQTIATHMSKLIQAKTVSIFDVLPEDKVIELARAFVGYTEESLNGMKEKYGSKFTWDELKMFRASLDQPSQ
jgi:hypothetical protein